MACIKEAGLLIPSEGHGKLFGKIFLTELTRAFKNHELICRYLSHILLHGFMRARYFGFLASSIKAKNITLIRSLLSLDEQGDKCISPTLQNASAMIGMLQSNVSQTLHAMSVSAVKTLAEHQPNHCMLNIPDTSSNVVSIQNLKTIEQPESIAELMKRVIGVDIERCKHCKIGRLEKILTYFPKNQKST